MNTKTTTTHGTPYQRILLRRAEPAARPRAGAGLGARAEAGGEEGGGVMAPKRQEGCKIDGCNEPRTPRTDMRFCETHLREYMAAAARKSAAKGGGTRSAEHQRLDSYHDEAIRQGATADQAMWVALAAEIEYQRGVQRTYWLKDFVAREIDYLRRVAPLRADRWAAPGAEEWAVVDDGYDFEEAV